MSQIKYWMWLACLTNLKPKAKLLALDYFGTPEELFFASSTDISRVESLRERDVLSFSDKNMDSAMRALERCVSEDIQIIAIGDSAYPSRLAHIYDSPAVLFVRGKLPPIDDEVAIAIAGTRNSSPYGEKMATKLGYEITRGGGLIISGLAQGIDTAAAVGALRAGGSVVGVLGTAIDEIYPRSNAALFSDVCVSGALVSEYPPGAKTTKFNFPARNRILSGLSLGVVIIEAPARSGALITAEYASEQGRDLFAVPGNADAANCAGSNALLIDAAKFTLSGRDVLVEYEGLYPHKIRSTTGAQFTASDDEVFGGKAAKAERNNTKAASKISENTSQDMKKDVDNEKDLAYIDLEGQLNKLNKAQLAIVSAIDKPEVYADYIITKTGLPASEVMSELTMLQLMGFVTPTGFDRYKLNIIMKRG